MIPLHLPLNRHLFYSLVVLPYREGAERINQAFAETDFLTLHQPVSMTKRLFSLLTGFALMIPLFSQMLWIFMRTFGDPDILSDPHLPADCS